jgi:cell division protein FtsA
MKNFFSFEPKTKIVSAIDIGTSSVKGLTVMKKSDSDEIEILSKVCLPSSGIRKGIVVEPDELAEKVNAVLARMEAEAERKIKEVFVNIGGGHVFSVSSKASIVVSRADQKISQEDIERVIDSAKAFPLQKNREIIDCFPIQFTVDEEKGIKEPLGMQGRRLEAEVLGIGVFSPYFRNLTEAVINGGAQNTSVICSSLSAAKACLTREQKELGVVVLDIGAGTTDLAIFEEGELMHLAVLPVGSANITNDIAIGLQIDTDAAEKIKQELGKYAANPSKKAKRREKIELPGGAVSFSVKFLLKIVEARVSEIFELAQKEIKKVSSGILPAGVVITGGGANLPNIVELARKKLKLPCRIGVPDLSSGGVLDIKGQKEDPSFSVVWGLVMAGMEDGKHGEVIGFEKGAGETIKKILKVFIP